LQKQVSDTPMNIKEESSSNPSALEMAVKENDI